MPRMEASRIAIAQISCKVGDLAANLAEIERAALSAADRGADLVVFPELTLPGYTIGPRFAEAAVHRDSPEVHRLRELSHEVGLAVGFVEAAGDGRYYNTAGCFTEGRTIGLHRKVFLPNYGRFEEAKYYARGRTVTAFDTPWGRVAMLICADAWHPALPYLAAHDGADVLLVMAASPADGLGDEFDTLTAWRRLVRTHALTLGVYVAFANHAGSETNETGATVPFTGGSMLAAPDGSSLADCPRDEPGAALAPICPERLARQRVTMPFRRDDDLTAVRAMVDEAVARRHAMDAGGLGAWSQSAAAPPVTPRRNGDVLARLGKSAGGASAPASSASDLSQLTAASLAGW